MRYLKVMATPLPHITNFWKKDIKQDGIPPFYPVRHSTQDARLLIIQ
jgi:hypothetical protein